MKCTRCMKPEELVVTAYGESLCEECYEEYKFSESGKIEHFIAIARGQEKLKSYDADHLGAIIKSWQDNKHLLALSKDEIDELEEIALLIGLLGEPMRI